MNMNSESPDNKELTDTKQRFSLLIEAPIDDFIDFAKNETDMFQLATILSYLPFSLIQNVISNLRIEVAGTLIQLLVDLPRIPLDDLEKLEIYVTEEMAKIQKKAPKSAGLSFVVKMIQGLPSEKKNEVMRYLEENSSKLANEIHQNGFTILFEDLIKFDDRAIQKILREVDSSDLAKALKTSSEEMKQKIFSNMSKRAGVLLREDMQFIGPIQLTDANASQEKIVQVVKNLERAGEIVISDGITDYVD